MITATEKSWYMVWPRVTVVHNIMLIIIKLISDARKENYVHNDLHSAF